MRIHLHGVLAAIAVWGALPACGVTLAAEKTQKRSSSRVPTDSAQGAAISQTASSISAPLAPIPAAPADLATEQTAKPTSFINLSGSIAPLPSLQLSQTAYRIGWPADNKIFTPDSRRSYLQRAPSIRSSPLLGPNSREIASFVGECRHWSNNPGCVALSAPASAQTEVETQDWPIWSVAASMYLRMLLHLD